MRKAGEMLIEISFKKKSKNVVDKLKALRFEVRHGSKLDS